MASSDSETGGNERPATPNSTSNIGPIGPPDWTPLEKLARMKKTGRQYVDLRDLGGRITMSGSEHWPPAVSDGLTIPCKDCGKIPRFDYHVSDEFWDKWVKPPDKTGVVCLPCLDERCNGVGLADALQEVQFTGTGTTVILKREAAWVYGDSSGDLYTTDT